MEIDSPTAEATEAYLSGIFDEFRKTAQKKEIDENAEDACKRIFFILTSREFTYLTRKQAEHFRGYLSKSIIQDLKARKPIEFFYSFSGGYHANIDPTKLAEFVFEPGLGELLALYQIKRFNDKVKEFYEKGVFFHILIDTLCAKLANSIPLKETEEHSSKLRRMIGLQGLGSIVDVIIESEQFQEEDYQGCFNCTNENHLGSLSQSEQANVERFWGKHCTAKEAFSATTRFGEIVARMRKLQKGIVGNKAHLVQRVAANIPAFRSFPGGASRIQCGEVALLFENSSLKRPFLLTNTNYADYSTARYKIKNSEIKQVLPEVILAQKKSVSS